MINAITTRPMTTLKYLGGWLCYKDTFIYTQTVTIPVQTKLNTAEDTNTCNNYH